MMGELRAADPRRVGPYRLAGRLGGGGMGQVYLGRSPAGRLVAVKVIRDELAADPEFRERFAREAAAAKSVSGVYTAPVIDADVAGTPPWLATAYVPGPALADAVRQHGPMPEASLRALAAGLAEGLAAVHAAGLVHRDLKPSNVLLAEDGPRIIDFGIAAAGEGSSLTRTGWVLGSPGFMAPEQAEGDAVGPPADVFSLGAVLVFAATGEGPFGAGSTAAVIYRIVHSPPRLDGVPAAIRSLVERCLAKEPGARPGPAGLLAELGETDLATGWLPAPVTAGLAGYLPPDAAADQDPRPASQDPPSAEQDPPSAEQDPRAAGQDPPTADQPREAASHPATVAASGTSGRTRRWRTRRSLAGLAGAALVLAAAATAAAVLIPGTRPPGRPSSSGPATQRAQAAAATASSSPRPASPSATATPGTGRPATPSPSGSPSGAPPPSPTAGQSSSTAPPAADPPPASAPATPAGVKASALSKTAITVSWADSSPGITGFRVDNGCPGDYCGGADAQLAATVGAVTSASFTVTPGAYDCFRVQAVNAVGSSAWSAYGCAQTPGITVPGGVQWTDTGVSVPAGYRVGITAAGLIHLGSGAAESPAGDTSCTNAGFPAPALPCYALIARIGSGAPFEVGASAMVGATGGELYLGVNDGSVAGNSGSWSVNVKFGSLPPAP